jgi:signal transduction histidine kinase
MSIVVFVLLVACLGAALWLMWRQRADSDERAASVAERAAVAEAVHAVAHDLDNLFAVLIANLSAAHDMPEDELQESLSDAEQAATNARALVRALRGQAMPPVADEPIVPIVKLLVALQRRRGRVIELRAKGALTFSGYAADAFRIVHNLLDNAVREAARLPDGKTIVTITDVEMTIENPAHAPENVLERMASSRGLGLGIARQAADRLEMRLEHSVQDGVVCFSLRRPDVPSSGMRVKTSVEDARKSA